LEELGGGIDEEVEVFEESEDSEVCAEADNEESFTGCFDGAFLYSSCDGEIDDG